MLRAAVVCGYNHQELKSKWRRVSLTALFELQPTPPHPPNPTMSSNMYFFKTRFPITWMKSLCGVDYKSSQRDTGNVHKSIITVIPQAYLARRSLNWKLERTTYIFSLLAAFVAPSGVMEVIQGQEGPISISSCSITFMHQKYKVSSEIVLSSSFWCATKRNDKNIYYLGASVVSLSGNHYKSVTSRHRWFYLITHGF